MRMGGSSVSGPEVYWKRRDGARRGTSEIAKQASLYLCSSTPQTGTWKG
jgi:hypothetical protein